MIRYRILYICALLAGVVLYIATNHRLMLIYILFLLATELLAAICLLVNCRTMRFRYVLDDACTIYQQVPLRLVMYCDSLLLIGKVRLRLEYHNLLFNRYRYQEIVLKPAWERRNYYELPFTSEDCGRVEVNVQEALCYDLLGIFCCKVARGQFTQIVISPEVRSFLVRRMQVSMSSQEGTHYDRYIKGYDVNEVFALRDYQEGDSLRQIHWKLSGKLDRLVVREFGHPTNYETLVLCDSGFCRQEDGGNAHQLMNAVLGMYASICANMLAQNLYYAAGLMTEQDLLLRQIDGQKAYEALMELMLGGTLRIGGAVQLEEIANGEGCRDYSKIVLVTGQMQERQFQKLSEVADLTVILLAESGSRQVEQQERYQIIRIPTGDDKDKVHSIEI